jgi:DtxR family Mn-dependent transcriptional regulator
MVKTLTDAGLVDYEPRLGVRLTREGQQLALHVLRRHRLVELFLVEILGLDWSHVHEEAERLEHAISDRVLDRIDTLLNHPSVDPHGDPIPTAKGRVTRPRLLSLIDAPLNIKLRIARIADQAPAFLQFIEQAGLKPGTTITIASRDEHADALTLRSAASQPLTLGTTAGSKVLVESI